MSRKTAANLAAFVVLAQAWVSVGCGGSEPDGADGEDLHGGLGAAGAAGAGVVARQPYQPGACPSFASEVVAYEFGPGQSIGQSEFPDRVFGPPEGLGCCSGSVAGVVSLGNGGTVTLGFGASRIVDGPGPDFIVFENPFFIHGNTESPFYELATVAVSPDGERWYEFPCTALDAPYGSCAGWHPVFAHSGQNDINPLDPEVAGGDAFDLAALPELAKDGVDRLRYVRVTDRADLTGFSGVFDLDGVGLIHAACP